jgi:rubrerythrin
MRYLHFANRAERDGFPHVARLFRAVAYAEFVHAGDHYEELRHLNGGFVANSMAAFGPGNTKKNLHLAIAGETFEIEEMYPTYIEVAKYQQEQGAQRTFEWAYRTEREHKMLYEKALEAVARDEDVQLGPVQVCNVCGYTLEGTVPGKCPVCGASKKKFESFA